MNKRYKETVEKRLCDTTVNISRTEHTEVNYNGFKCLIL